MLSSIYQLSQVNAAILQLITIIYSLLRNTSAKAAKNNPTSRKTISKSPRLKTIIPIIDKAENAALAASHFPLISQNPKIISKKLNALSNGLASKKSLKNNGKNPIQSLGFKKEDMAA